MRYIDIYIHTYIYSCRGAKISNDRLVDFYFFFLLISRSAKLRISECRGTTIASAGTRERLVRADCVGGERVRGKASRNTRVYAPHFVSLYSRPRKCCLFSARQYKATMKGIWDKVQSYSVVLLTLYTPRSACGRPLP